MADDNKNSSQGQGSKKPTPNRIGRIVIIASLVLLGAVLANNALTSKSGIPYSQFLTLIKSKQITQVVIMDSQIIKGTYKNASGKDTAFTTRIPYFDKSLLTRLEDLGIPFRGASKPISIFSVLLNWLPFLLIIGLFIYMSRSAAGGGAGGVFGFAKSRMKQVDGKKLNLSFNDVAGQIEAKKELEEIVDFLKEPTKYTSIGARIPRGVLLVGNPGTGKTLMAKAVSGEAHVPFFQMSGSDFVEMFVGVGASRVRDMFERCRKSAPCILFIDEIDAVGRARGGSGISGGHDEREQTLNQLLVEMDGFTSTDNVIVLAATNRADVLDKALLRPGRFDRQIVIDMPDAKERSAILYLHSKKVKISDDVNLDIIARSIPGTSGADIANIVNEAAIFAARENRTRVEMNDFENAVDKVLMGVMRSSRAMTDDEKLMTAYHEAGHTLMHYFVPKSDPLHKVTIIPRGRALGVTFSLPEKDTYSHSKSDLEGRLRILFGGYSAETVVYDETTTGTQQDLKQATAIARKMVCEWGMTKAFGPVALEKESLFQEDTDGVAGYSDQTASKIDNEVYKILTAAKDDSVGILTKERERLDLLAKTLVTKETLTDAEVRSLLDL